MSASLSPKVLRGLYLSHSLSTWNSRMFEFGAVLFLARIFPRTQLFTSIYALVRALGSILLSNSIGAAMDRSNRLTAMRSSIVWQRLPGLWPQAYTMELPLIKPLVPWDITKRCLHNCIPWSQVVAAHEYSLRALRPPKERNANRIHYNSGFLLRSFSRPFTVSRFHCHLLGMLSSGHYSCLCWKTFIRCKYCGCWEGL